MKLKRSTQILGRYFFLPIVLLALSACGAPQNSIEAIKAEYESSPEYAVILNDMEEEGNFFPTYYHQYRVDIGDQKIMKPPVEVDENFYKNNVNFLGMVLAAKTNDGKSYNTPFPPGYQYVGNSQYGHWQQGSGGSFWAFYGQYAMMSNLMGWAGGGLRRNHYDGWNSSMASHRPYYGPNNQFGTNGSYTQKAKPAFYAKRKARKARSSSRFQNKIKNRTGRSKNTFRSRGFSFGK